MFWCCCQQGTTVDPPASTLICDGGLLTEPFDTLPDLKNTAGVPRPRWGWWANFVGGNPNFFADGQLGIGNFVRRPANPFFWTIDGVTCCVPVTEEDVRVGWSAQFAVTVVELEDRHGYPFPNAVYANGTDPSPLFGYDADPLVYGSSMNYTEVRIQFSRLWVALKLQPSWGISPGFRQFQWFHNKSWDSTTWNNPIEQTQYLIGPAWDPNTPARVNLTIQCTEDLGSHLEGRLYRFRYRSTVDGTELCTFDEDTYVDGWGDLGASVRSCIFADYTWSISDGYVDTDNVFWKLDDWTVYSQA